METQLQKVGVCPYLSESSLINMFLGDNVDLINETSKYQFICHMFPEVQNISFLEEKATRCTN